MYDALGRREPELEVIAEPEQRAADRVQVLIGDRLHLGARQGTDNSLQAAQESGGVFRHG